MLGTSNKKNKTSKKSQAISFYYQLIKIFFFKFPAISLGPVLMLEYRGEQDRVPGFKGLVF